MRLKSMIFKAIVASLLSSIVTFVAGLLLHLVINVNSSSASIAINIALCFISAISYAIILVALLHIYQGNGEGDVWEDYPEKYSGILRDLPKIVAKERNILFLILSINVLHFALRSLNLSFWHISIINSITDLLISTCPLVILFPDTIPYMLIGYLCGTLFTCCTYVAVFGIFRWKWRRFM